MPGAAEAGDRFGRALTQTWERIYVGVPGEDLGELSNTGMVNVLHHPNTPALSDRILGGTSEAGDQFAPTPSDTWTQVTGAREAGDNYGGSSTVRGSRQHHR